MNELDPSINNEPDSVINNDPDLSSFEGPIPGYERIYYFYKTEDENRKLEPGDILYLEAKDNYVVLHLTTDQTVMIRSTLEGLSRTFPPGMFLRIHRTYCVSCRYVTAWTKTYVKIGDIQLPVTKNYYPYLENRFDLLGTF